MKTIMYGRDIESIVEFHIHCMLIRL